MKEYITPEQTLDFVRELDDAELFAQGDYLDSLWEPAVGDMFITELWRKVKIPMTIVEIEPNSQRHFGDNTRFHSFNSRTKSRYYDSYFKNDSRPLFSVGQLINILGTPTMMYDDQEKIWNVFANDQRYSAIELCDALWDAARDKVKRVSIYTVI